MSDTMDNRTDYPYSSDMETIIMDLDTNTFTAHWLHLDDFTECDRHEVCNRDTFARGGRPEHPDNLTV